MNEETTAYQEALNYIYSFVDYSLTRNLQFSPEKFDLNRMVVFLERLGNPHKQYPVIHVAGTKGKGSTAAMIASSLRTSGYRVGFYSSPHLSVFNERIQVDGTPIDSEVLVDLVEEVKPVVAQIERLTTFEITTAIGFLYFARQNIDVAVVEVGLGGRLDATNVVDPLVSVITAISLDHVAVLGDTIAKIAYEKAGIIKPGRPVVMAPQHDEARQVIEQVSQERGCPLIEVQKDFAYQPVSHSLEGQAFNLSKNGALQAEDFHIPLLGLHQIENAATAYAALQIARDQGLKQISAQAIRKGFAEVQWPGRFEVLRRDPPVIVDSAHNRDSAHRLAQALEDYLPGKPVVLVFGASEDKDLEGMFAELLPHVRYLVATQSVHPRAMDVGKMIELARNYGCPGEAVLPLENALAVALERAGKEAAVVAAGSLFIAAAVRDTWHKWQAESAALPEQKQE
ncbi:MAG: bifunctional folylpolyglutamate synthase/dihydrofolate synthase [Chloroflexi bacterium]|nr:bifunctional folylpolyglutamate synthase/dihydrofolate synthase [Chloroflexota bacterium]